MKKLLLVAPLLFMAPLLSVAQQTEQVDLTTIHRIKEEALGRNTKVMDHVFYLTDVNGPRLQNSKGYRAAADWAVKRLKDEYGLSNVHLEKWAPFGKGWNLEHYSGHMLEPQYQPIIAMPMAWTAGTNGVVTGSPILVTPQTQEQLDAFKGKLAGKIVLISPKRDLAMSTTPLGVRLSDAELQEIQTAQIQIPGLFGRGGRGGPPGMLGGRGGVAGGLSPATVQTFLKAEKPALVIQISRMGDGMDNHHLIEDVGIALGKAIYEALGDKRGIERYGSMMVPLDDALVACSIDLSGRSYLNFQVTFLVENLGDFKTEMIREFFRAVADNGRFNLHLMQMNGDVAHHLCEASFKAFARAFRQAKARTGSDERSEEHTSELQSLIHLV